VLSLCGIGTRILVVVFFFLVVTFLVVVAFLVVVTFLVVVVTALIIIIIIIVIVVVIIVFVPRALILNEAVAGAVEPVCFIGGEHRRWLMAIVVVFFTAPFPSVRADVEL